MIMLFCVISVIKIRKSINTSNFSYICDYFGDGEVRVRSILEIEADESTQRHIEELTRERGGFSEDSFISSIEQSWVRDARESGDITGTQNKSSDSGDGVVASSEYKEEAEPTGSYNNDRTGGWVSIKLGEEVINQKPCYTATCDYTWICPGRTTFKITDNFSVVMYEELFYELEKTGILHPYKLVCYYEK